MSTKNPNQEPGLQEPGLEPTIRPTVPAVYAAIHAVLADLTKEGIAKDHKNVQQGYQFRGIDDVLNTLSSLLAKHGLLILPRVISRECQERQTQRGGVLFYVTVKIEYDFIAVSDGSMYTTTIFGEAMDSADKATNKAMSAGYKYNAIQSFAIPTKGEDNDADATTPDPGQSKEALRLAAAEAKIAAAKKEAATKPVKPATPKSVASKSAPPEAAVPWIGEVLEVNAHSSPPGTKNPWKYFDVVFADGKIARTFSETLSGKARELIGGPPVQATVNPGRFENSWKLTEIEAVDLEFSDDFTEEEN